MSLLDGEERGETEQLQDCYEPISKPLEEQEHPLAMKGTVTLRGDIIEQTLTLWTKMHPLFHQYRQMNITVFA